MTQCSPGLTPLSRSSRNPRRTKGLRAAVFTAFLSIAVHPADSASTEAGSGDPAPATVSRDAALAGTYLVGAGQPVPFNSLTSAVAEINAVGVSAAVTFLLTDPVYTSPAETFPITLSSIPGAGPLSPLTIQPAPGATVEISGSVAGAVLRLNDSDFIVLDGSNSGGTSRDLTIRNTSTSGATAAVWLSSSGAGAGCSDNVIRNCNLACGADQTGSVAETFGIILSGTAIATIGDGSGNDRNIVSGNAIWKCRFGVFARGANTALNVQNRIEDNRIGPASFGNDQIGRGGIVVMLQDQATIHGNEVRFVGGSVADAASGADRVGLGIGSFLWPGPATPVTNSVVSGNLIHDVAEEKTFSAVGLLLGGTGTPSGNRVANNMIYGIRSNGANLDQAVGIGILAGNGDMVVFNTVSMAGDLDPAPAAAAARSAAGLRILSSAPANLRLENNVLSVDLNSDAPGLLHYAIVAPSTSYGWGSGGSNHNDLYAEPANPQMVLGGIGTAFPYSGVPNLAAWQTQFTPNQDGASITALPPFVGPANLHLLPDAPTPLRDGGVPIPLVADDYDGQSRDPLTPDIGADEVAILSRAEATQLVIDQVLLDHPDAAELVAFLYNRVAPDSLLPPGAVVSDYDSSFIHVVGEPSYLFWSDNHPTAMWSHSSTFVFVGAASGELTVQPGLTWPLLGDIAIDRFVAEGNASPERIFGSYAEVVDVPFTPPVTTVTPKTAWAIVFLGKTRKDDEKDSHRKDIDRVKDILNKAPMGPMVSKDNIKEVTGPMNCGASKQAFCDALDEISGCDKLYIWYLGHGGSDGSMGMRKDNGNDEKFSFKELAEKLKAKGVKEVCVVMDCCYSGLVIAALEKAGLKGTVITAAGNQEGHRTEGVGWNLTVALQRCMNDTLADLDHDGHITLLEGLAWARSQNPQLVTDRSTGDILGDKLKTVFDPPVITNLGQFSDGDEGNQICFQVKEHVYQVGKNRVSRKSLYVYNLSAEAHKGTKGYRVQVKCKKKNGMTTTKLPRIVLAGKDDPDGKDQICLMDVTDCDVVTLDKVAEAPGGLLQPKGDPPFRTATSLYHRAADYLAGEYVLQEIPVVGSTGDHYIATVENLPGWNLSIDPPAFTWGAALDTERVVVRGAMPPSAIQGDRFFATIINTTAAETTDWRFDGLLSDTLAVPIIGGDSFIFREVRSSSGLNVTAGQATTLRSTLEVKAPSTVYAVGPGGSLLMQESVVVPDSGAGYTFTAQGHLEWDGSSLNTPDSGMRLLGASGYLSLGSVYGSRTDGMYVTGNQSSLDVHQFLIESSTRDGILFDGASNAVFRTVRIIASGRYDVNLQNGSDVTLVDASYDDAKVSVEGGSTLTRKWTTPFLFTSPTGPVPGAHIEIRNALGALVVDALTDADGFTDFDELIQYRQAGAVRTDHTPHTVTAHWATLDTTFTYTADAARAVEVVWGSAVSGSEGKLPERFLFNPNFPNPFNNATTFYYELPADSDVKLEVYDLAGRRVITLMDGPQPAGQHSFTWNPDRLSAGVYLGRLTAGRSVQTRKLIRLCPVR